MSLSTEPCLPEPRSPVRIAMWSGPRNLSTAMMRAFGNRGDCAVIDEPFYAAYLALSGLDHPMRAEILAAHENDWREVARSLAEDRPVLREGEAAVVYAKHMTHHMLPAIGRDWMDACRHAFLIRHPARVLGSYAAKREAAELRDIGVVEQSELFERAADLAGTAPPVVDADDLLADPGRILSRLCTALGIAFDPAMLAWPPGPRASDGVWASHWYDAVNRSTGFAAATPLRPLADPHLQRLEEAALPHYARLAAVALR